MKDVLDYLKLVQGKMSLEQVQMSLQNTVKSGIRNHASNAQSKNIDFVLDIEPNVPDLLIGDSYRTSEILNFLLDNAVKFTQQGKILLQVKMVNKSQTHVTLHFSVQDTGYGMSEDKFKSLFNPVTMATSL